MKLTVLGATGKVGSEIVRQAAATGHEVTAVARDPTRLALPPQPVDVHHLPDIDDPDALSGAIVGRDAVLSALGPRSRKNAGIMARLTDAILDAMALADVRRLVVVSSSQLGPLPEGESFGYAKIVTPLVRAILNDVYVDLRAMEAKLIQSTAEWTAIRPPRLVDQPLTGRYRTALGTNLRRGHAIGRADVAHAMLAMINDPTTIHHTVGIAY